MTKGQRAETLDLLREKLEEYDFFYLINPSGMSAAETSDFRRKCFQEGVEMLVVKNTYLAKLMREAGDEKGYAPLFDTLHGQTAVLFTTTANLPGRMLKQMKKDKKDRPALKAAYIAGGCFIGEEQLDTLASLKSREELLGEVIGLLQSPAKNVVSALLSGGQKIAGLVKALEERAA